MNLRILFSAAILAAATAVAAAQTETKPATAPATAPAADSPFKTDGQRSGYALGLQIGKDLGGLGIDPSALAQGFKDASTGADFQMTAKEIEETLNKLKAKMMAKADEEMAQEANNNKKAGETFLVENGKKEGIKTTASGLQYKVLKSGTGKMPKSTDNVTVNYRGTTINGKQFDASDAGKPVSFPLNRVIPGWTEGLQLMKEGDKFQFFIPSKLAYDERSPSPDIGPNEVLIFEVELVKVN